MLSWSDLHFTYLDNLKSICYVHNLVFLSTLVMLFESQRYTISSRRNLLVHVLNTNTNCPSVSLELLYLGQLHHGTAHVP